MLAFSAPLRPSKKEVIYWRAEGSDIQLRTVFKRGGGGCARWRPWLSRREADDVLCCSLRMLPRQVVASLLVGLALRARQHLSQQLLARHGQDRVLVAPQDERRHLHPRQ